MLRKVAIFNLSPNMCLFRRHIFDLSPNMCVVFGFVYFRTAIAVFCCDIFENVVVQKQNKTETTLLKYVRFADIRS